MYRFPHILTFNSIRAITACIKKHFLKCAIKVFSNNSTENDPDKKISLLCLKLPHVFKNLATIEFYILCIKYLYTLQVHLKNIGLTIRMFSSDTDRYADSSNLTQRSSSLRSIDIFLYLRFHFAGVQFKKQVIGNKLGA